MAPGHRGQRQRGGILLRKCLTRDLPALMIDGLGVFHSPRPRHRSVVLRAHPKSEKEMRMPQGQAIFLGLNQTGLIAFIILLVLCLPLCWIPFVIDSCKGNPAG